MFNPVGSKPTVCTFAHTPKLILTGHESGKVALWDAKTGEEVLSNERAHMDVVTDLQISPDPSYFITASKDKTARVSLYHLGFRFLLMQAFYSFTTREPYRFWRRTKRRPRWTVLLSRLSDHMFVAFIYLYIFRRIVTLFPDPAWWWSRGYERYHDFSTSGQVRDALLA